MLGSIAFGDEERVTALFENWSIVVLVEPNKAGDPILSFLKNSGEYVVVSKDLPVLRGIFAADFKGADQRAILYATTFIDGKKFSRSTRLSAEAAEAFRHAAGPFVIRPEAYKNLKEQGGGGRHPGELPGEPDKPNKP